ncbi:phage tail tape measure protein [Bacteroides fluxus]
MAGKSTISITFRLDGDSKEFKELTTDAAGLKKVLQSAIAPAENLKKSLINWSQGVQAIDAITNTVSTVSSALSQFSDRMKGLQSANIAITQLTGKTGDEMLKLRSKVQAVSEHFGTDFNETLRAANALSKGFGISMEDAMKLVQDGLVSGANAGGDFIDTVREYPRYFKEAGLSAEDFIAITTNAAQQGVFSDKGVDVIKEGNLRIREMTTATADALNGIGISAEKVQADLQAGSITTFDVMQMVAAKLNELPASSAAVGTAIADIFGGPGEDAGLEYIKTLANIQLNMDAVKAATQGTAEQQERQIQMQENLKNGLSGLIDLSAIYTDVKPYVDLTAQIGMAAMGIGGLIKTVKAMNVQQAILKTRIVAVAAAQKMVTIATTAWTAIQKVLNLVLTANPIGLIITAIGALVAALIAAYKNCEGFRKIVDKVWEAIKPLANAIMNGLAKAFEWLVEKCKEAWEWLKNILGLGKQKVEVAVEVSKPKTPAPTLDMDKPNASDYTYTPTAGAGKVTGAAKPKWTEDASNLKAISDNVQILNEKLQTASAEEAVLINQQIELWEQKADAIRNAGKAADDNTPLWKEDADTLREINDNIQILNEKLQDATAEEAAAINQQIAAWNAKADAIRNAGAAVDNTPLWKEDASNLKEISDNIQILNDQLQTATIEEAALINQQIAAWKDKADAIREAGVETEKVSMSTGKALQQGWGGIKNIGSSIEGITSALQGNGNAWQVVTGIIDGFIGLYTGIQTVVGIIQLLTGASAAHAATKGVEATAETTEATVRATTAATNAAASAAIITANKLEAASWKELAASEYMAAHAYIPFAGFGIAMGFVTAMLAATAAAGIPMLAEGGIASGPTLAMVGEYAGAKGNPEVIAPLDKLRGMLAQPASMDFGKVEFEIKGRTLVGILNKENNITKRS